MKTRKEIIQEIQDLQRNLMTQFEDRVRGALQGMLMGETFSDRTPIPSKNNSEEVKWAVNVDMLCAWIEQVCSSKQLTITDLTTVIQQFKGEEALDGLPISNLVFSSGYVQNPIDVAKADFDETHKNLVFYDFVLCRSVFAGLWDYQSMDTVVQNAEKLCRLTHNSSQVVGSSVVVAYLIHKILLDELFTENELIWLSRNYSSELSAYVEYAYEGNIHMLKPNTSETPEKNIMKTMGLAIWATLQTSSFFDTYSFLGRELQFFREIQAVVIAVLGAKQGYANIPVEIGSPHGSVKAYRGSELVHQVVNDELTGYVSGRADSLILALQEEMKRNNRVLLIP